MAERPSTVDDQELRGRIPAEALAQPAPAEGSQPAGVMGLQATLGNAAVERALAPSGPALLAAASPAAPAVLTAGPAAAPQPIDLPPATSAAVDTRTMTWPDGREITIVERAWIPAAPPREAGALLAPQVTYVREIKVRTRDGTTVAVTIRGATFFETPPTDVGAALRAPGRAAYGIFVSGKRPDGTPIIGYEEATGDPNSLIGLTGAGPEVVHFGLDEEAQYRAVIELLEKTAPQHKWKEVEREPVVPEPEEEPEPAELTREELERMSEDEKGERFWRETAKRFWEIFSIPELVVEIVLALLVVALAVAAIALGSEALLIAFVVLVVAGLLILLGALIVGLVRDIQAGDYAAAIPGALAKLALFAAGLLGLVAVVLAFIFGPEIVLALGAIALALVFVAVMFLLVRLLVDRGDAVSSNDPTTFKRKVDDGAETLKDLVTTVIVTIVTVVLTPIIERFLPPLLRPKAPVIDLPPEEQGRPPTLEQRRAQFRAQQAERQRAAEIRQGIAELEAEIQAGTKRIPPDDLAWVRQNPRHQELAYDPAKKTYSVREAKAALRAEEEGLIPGPVKRAAHPGDDFIDGRGRPWDHKWVDPSESLHDQVETIAGPARDGENVLADLSSLSPQAAERVRVGVADALKGLGRPPPVAFVGPGAVPPRAAVPPGAAVGGAAAGTATGTAAGKARQGGSRP
jgi:hypothetical protein